MEIIRAASTADLLALTPALVGFEPRRSLVLIPFVGTRTLPSALRVDLPRRRREKEARELSHVMLGMLSRFRGVDGVAVVVYSDATFEQERGIPYLDLARAMTANLERAGFRVVEAACVAPDGWELYDGTHHARGRPLSEIAASSVHSELPERSAEAVPEVAAALRASAHLRLLRGDLLDADIIEVIEDAVTAEEWTAATAATLLALVTSPPLRDVVLLQWAFGRQTGEDVYDQSMLWSAMRERTGETMDELVARELAEAAELGVEAEGVQHAGLLRGHSDAMPSRERLGSALRAARRLVAFAPSEALAPALTIEAWMLWALGRGSAAGDALDRALDHDPGYGLAHVLQAVLGAGMLPDWVFTAAAGAHAT